jgi:hypothetical protein
MKSSKHIQGSSFGAAIVASAVCVGAHAEYRCANVGQLDHAERRACELAKQQTPEALIRFVNRTKALYDLYVNDYVNSADVERWESAESKPTTVSPMTATGQAEARQYLKSD